MAGARPEFPIEAQLKADMKDAMRNRDQVRVNTVRMAIGAIHNLEIARTDKDNADYGKPLTEQDCINVIEQEAKKRRQAIPLYEKAGRTELAEQEQRELDILQSYVQSSQLSDDELHAIIVRLVEVNGGDFRKVMPLAIKETKGRADGGRVQRLVRDLTQ